MAFKPQTRFIDLSLIHYSILISVRLYCKMWLWAIKYIVIAHKPFELTKESILIFWWTILGSNKPYLSNKLFKKSFCFFNKPQLTLQTLENPFGFSIIHIVFQKTMLIINFSLRARCIWCVQPKSNQFTYMSPKSSL